MQEGPALGSDTHPPGPSSIAIIWLPLGAGGRSVRWNGRVFEAAAALSQHRPPRDLFHSALEIRLERVRFVIEMTPVWGGPATDRGVVLEGPVGARILGHSALFRYEIRRWLNGSIPDAAEAVGSPHVVSEDRDLARTLLTIVPLVPALTWGRDELKTGDMWNSNSLISWLLARSGHNMSTIHPPPNGRAPGWHSGLELAARQPARQWPERSGSATRAFNN